MPKAQVVALVQTLATEEDSIWPKNTWPAMRFKGGIQLGAKGGHGPIRYTVETYDPSECIQFRFTQPKGFHGIHKFQIEPLATQETLVRHTIAMNTSGTGTLAWIFGIRSLHDALLEDAFDQLENALTQSEKRTPWSLWVRLLRRLLR